MPGLRVVTDHRLEALADALFADLEPALRGDPALSGAGAGPEVVVPGRAVARWLARRAADRWGVCAGWSWPVAGAWHDAALARLLGDPPLADERLDPVAWAICAALPGLAGDPALQPVLAYVQEDAPDAVPGAVPGDAPESCRPGDDAGADAPDVVTAREAALAGRLAQVFQRVLRERPAWARAWSRGEAPPDAPADGRPGPLVEPWLPVLWRAVQDRLAAPHQAERTATAVARLEAGAALPVPLAPVRWFAPGHVPASTLELLRALARRVEVVLYLRAAGPGPVAPGAPADPAWATLDRAEALALDASTLPEHAPHPVTGSLGRAGRALRRALAGLGAREEALPGPDVPDDAPGPDAPALARWQRALVGTAAQVAPRARLAWGDDSLAVHGCYGPVRQVEALREALLHLLREHPELEPRDVLVLTPDLDRFAPLLTAVFSQGAADGRPGRDGAPPRLPLELQGATARRTQPVAEALLRLFELADGRLAITPLLDLLGLEPVRRRFGLDAEDLPHVARWLAEGGFRWGADARDREPVLALERRWGGVDHAATWRRSREQLVLGLLLPDEAPPLGEVAPFATVEGMSADRLGRALAFGEAVVAARDALRAARPAAAWAHDLAAWVGRLTEPAADATWQTEAVLDRLEQLRRAVDLAGLARPLELPALRAWLEARFEEPTSAGDRGSGAVVVAPLTGSRITPRRVVALLGMDEGAFPRSPTAPSFDPVAASPRATDPDTRDLDRGALLDALLAARSHLLVLYTAFDERTGQAREPAVPVAELLDALDLAFEGPAGEPARAALTTLHPLQGFSPRAFEPRRPLPGRPGERGPWSFDAATLAGVMGAGVMGAASASAVAPAAVASGAREAGESPPERETIALDDLVRFFRSPTRDYLRRVVGLVWRDEEVAPDDLLPLELDALTTWTLTRDLVEQRLAGRGAEPLRRTLRGRFGMPLGGLGERIVDELLLASRAHLAATEAWTGDPDAPAAPFETIPIDVPLEPASGPVRLVGQVRALHGDLVTWIPSEEGNRYAWLEPWLHWTAWQAADPAGAGRAVVAFKGGLHGLTLADAGAPWGPAGCHGHLAWLVDTMRRGLRALIPLFRRASPSVAWTIDGGRKQVVVPRAPEDVRALLETQRAHPLWKVLRDEADAWDGNKFRRGDGQDPEIAHAYGDACPIDPDEADLGVVAEFVAGSRRLWSPLWPCRRTSSQVGAWAPGRGA